jgi:hypothetical protein
VDGLRETAGKLAMLMRSPFRRSGCLTPLRRPHRLHQPDRQESPDAFPRHIIDDSHLIRCESGCRRTLGPSGRDETAYGLILLEQSGRRLAIYHNWGEI